MSKWRKWRGLSWADRRLLVQAAALLVLARLRLPYLDFRAKPSAADGSLAGTPPRSSLVQAQHSARLMGIAAAHVPVNITCMHRSLALWWLLRRRNIPCELRLGAGNEGGAFEAHMWVQCEGVALNEQDAHLARYSAFDRAVVPVRRGSMEKRADRLLA